MRETPYATNMSVRLTWCHQQMSSTGQCLEQGDKLVQKWRTHPVQELSGVRAIRTSVRPLGDRWQGRSRRRT